MNPPDENDDAPRPPSPGRPKPPRPGPPPSADDGATGEASGGDRPRRAKKKPTPVRDMPAVEAPPPSPTDPDLEEAEVSIDDEAWVVRVLGRSGGRRAAAPLLLLGFWRGEAEGDAELEALVVGRTLAELTAPALRRAYGEARRPPEGEGEGQSRRRRRSSGGG